MRHVNGLDVTHRAEDLQWSLHPSRLRCLGGLNKWPLKSYQSHWKAESQNYVLRQLPHE